jgi:hypothetical protein
MSVELVIARYNEDILWLNKVKNMKITIYNKGKDNIDYKFIKLPNIGRESHTYLTHIINNYDNLLDTTIFCQGDPFFHSPDFLELIKNSKSFQPIQPLTYYYSPCLNKATNNDKKIVIEKGFRINGMPPNRVLNISKDEWINNLKIYVEYYNKDGIVMYPEYYRDYFIIDFFKIFKKKKYKFNSILEFMKNRYRLDNINLDILVPMSYAAIFSVSKEVIRSRSLDFYQNILNLLIEDFIKYNIDSGLLLERLWLSIFNYQKYNKHYLKLYSKDFKINYYEITTVNNQIEFSIKTSDPLNMILKIDEINYYFLFGYNKIYIIYYKDKKYKLNFDVNNLFIINKFTKIKFLLKNNLKIYFNKKLIINFPVEEIKIESLKIEETFTEIKL